MSRPSRAPIAGLADGGLQPVRGEGVFAADIEVTGGGGGGEAGDHHRLDDGERILLHYHAVLEGARLRLVGVAYHVVRARRGSGDRLPFGGGRERRTATALQLGVAQLAQHAVGAKLDGAAQCGAAAVAAVVADALGIGLPDTPQQRKLRGRHGIGHLRRGATGTRHGGGHLRRGATGTRHGIGHLWRGATGTRHGDGHLRRGATGTRHGIGHLRRGTRGGRHGVGGLADGGFRRRPFGRGRGSERGAHRVGGGRGQGGVGFAGQLQQHRGRGLAQAQTGAG